MANRADVLSRLNAFADTVDGATAFNALVTLYSNANRASSLWNKR
jgi:hypothetical protein